MTLVPWHLLVAGRPSVHSVQCAGMFHHGRPLHSSAVDGYHRKDPGKAETFYKSESHIVKNYKKTE